MHQWATIGNCHVQVTLKNTEIWLWKGPSWQSPKSPVQRPYCIGPKFHLTFIKVLSQVITVPKMNEIHSFMSENGPQNGFHMLSIWKMNSAAWRPSWIKISKWGYVHQWATIDHVHAWPCPGHILNPNPYDRGLFGPQACIFGHSFVHNHFTCLILHVFLPYKFSYNKRYNIAGNDQYIWQHGWWLSQIWC